MSKFEHESMNNIGLRPKLLIHCGVGADCLLIIFSTYTILKGSTANEVDELFIALLA